MRVVTKLVILLAVLAICMPAQGEILVYSKLYDCWGASSPDMLVWDVDEWMQRGFLVLNVIYVDGDIVEVDGAYQVEYVRDGRDKLYWDYPEEFTIERVEVGGEVIWVLEYILATETTEAEIIMVRGKPRDINIGLGRNEKREVARELTGYWLDLQLGMGVEKQMCTFSLRLHSRFTKLSNHPDECNQSFECAVLGLVIPWLEGRGYEEVS
jgi:hypothetical protein